MGNTHKISQTEREAAIARFEFEAHADLEAALEFGDESDVTILDQRKPPTESVG